MVRTLIALILLTSIEAPAMDRIRDLCEASRVKQIQQQFQIPDTLLHDAMRLTVTEYDRLARAI